VTDENRCLFVSDRTRYVKTPAILDVCKRMEYVPYIGWDVVVTPDGFTVTEGNGCPDVGHQSFSPLLSEPRVSAFYDRFHAL